MKATKGWIGASLALTLVFAAAPLPAQVLRGYDVKAAFLYNLITFTDWPSKAFTSTESPYVIGLVGEDPFGPALDLIVDGEKIKGRPLVVRRFERVESVHQCHILFISASESSRTAEILSRLEGLPVLTVSDMPGFAERGGAIGLTGEARVGLVINPTVIRASNFAVSSKLLRLAQLSKEGNAP
ncbi:MAG TPA: YfiR family protein [Opitutaceae bacterium]